MKNERQCEKEIPVGLRAINTRGVAGKERRARLVGHGAPLRQAACGGGAAPAASRGVARCASGASMLPWAGGGRRHSQRTFRRPARISTRKAKGVESRSCAASASTSCRRRTSSASSSSPATDVTVSGTATAAAFGSALAASWRLNAFVPKH